MKDVYVKNPQMGDPASVDPRLSEISQNIEKLQLEVQKFEVSSLPVTAQEFFLFLGKVSQFGLSEWINNEQVKHILSWVKFKETHQSSTLREDAMQLAESWFNPVNKCHSHGQ